MISSKIRLIVLILFGFFLSNYSNAQIKINGSNKVCLGNLASFSYTPPAGVSIASYQWNFGDGYTSTSAKPGHLYKAISSLSVSLTATKVGGGTLQESLPIDIVGLPKAGFAMTNNSDSCSFTNNICFKDLSVPADPGQNITSRLTIWGDGVYDKETQPRSNPNSCHHYKAVDKYNISIEITDKYGCKDFVTKQVEIIPGVQAGIKTEISYPKCEEAKLCITNSSIQSPGVGVNYYWKFNTTRSTSNYFLTPYCYTANLTEKMNVELAVTAANGCTDTAISIIDLVVDTAQRVIESNFDEICYGNQSAIEFWAKELPSDSFIWHLDDSLIQSHKSRVFFNTKVNKLLPGTHLIKCKIIRGNCIIDLQKSILVKGPVAQIEIFNGTQCGTNRKVFFVGDKNEQFTPNYLYQWQLTDPKGENCIADRANDLNKYKNCNTSTDWWHKHQYTDLINGYWVNLLVKDTAIGCSDSTFGIVNLDACGNCNGNCDPRSICQNKWLFSKERYLNDPVKVTFDSGTTWVKYPVFIDSSYLGTYDFGFIYKYLFPAYARDFGDDSIQIIRDTNKYSDTILCDNNLTVLPNRKNSFSLAPGPSCNPLEIIAKLEKTNFFAGDTIIFYWADSFKLIVTDSVDFNLDSVILKFNKSGYKGGVNAVFKSQGNCEYSYFDTITIGYEAKLNITGPLCTNNEICFDVKIKNLKNNSTWSNQNNLGTVKWQIDSLPSIVGKYNLCQKFTRTGSHNLSLILENKEGCKDTLQRNFTVQTLKANVTDDSRNFYCNQLRQFFDSSELVFKDSGDVITKYLWDFGTGKYSTLEKDPFRSFVGITDDINVSHIVESQSGCRDTVNFTLGIIGSKPKFRIKDSIGCAPFEVEFINESQNASQYIWEYGDPTNSTTITSDPGNIKFNYTQAGRYFVNLIGIDTVYNPHTGSVYYCHTSFPTKGEKLWVNILPSYKTGITAPDTICLNDFISFKSLSDTGFTTDHWSMGDGATYIQGAGKPLTYRFKNAGMYDVKLFPRAPRISNQPYCHDSFATKKITVLGVDASFDIAAKSSAPIFYFTNTSVPNTSSWEWSYGQSGSNQNASTQKDGKHNYGKHTGTYSVCLTATNIIGCKAKECKQINNDYVESIQTYNVFTPGVVDGANDEFDIEIVGESEYHLTIFNRYGVAVFTGNVDAENGQGINWNGSLNNKGAKCASGTYYYTFKYAFKQDPKEKKTVKGVITLLR